MKMTRENFEKFCEEFRLEAKKEMTAKNQDYRTGSTSQLHYADLAKDIAVTPMQTWAVLFMKHVHAILRYVRDGEVASETIISRLIDVHNYAVLGAALVEEMRSSGDLKFVDLTMKEPIDVKHVRNCTNPNAIPASSGYDPNVHLATIIEGLIDELLKKNPNNHTPNVADLLRDLSGADEEIDEYVSFVVNYVDAHDLGRSVKLVNVLKNLRGES